VSDRALIALAQEAGLSVDWIDATGRKQSVSRETLRAVLSALGFPATNAAAIHDSRRRLWITKHAPSRSIVATAGKALTLPAQSQLGEITLEDGSTSTIRLRRLDDKRATFRAPLAAGYHRVEIDGCGHILAIAPARAFQPTTSKLWGLAAQVYALRGGRTKGFGDFAALASFARTAGRAGADALAISPVHASMPEPIGQYSPYSPSSRFALDPLFIAVPSGTDAIERQALIDWRTASEAKLKALDHAYERFLGNSRARRDFTAFVRTGGLRLLAHARFEALHARFAATGRADWRRWPMSYRDANSADATRLGRADQELERHLFRQWLSDRQLGRAQKAARDAGMTIGLITDLAVGVHPRGSHAWSAPYELLDKLSVGAPPDALGPDGQDWGLTTLSPFAMRADGYASYIATLRACMRHAGGIRVDHAMGLMRLWVIPDGASSSGGVYLSYPFEDLLRLLVLESVRNRAPVIAEDLGTVPSGFRERIARAGLFGMRVLFFERERDGSFKIPSTWDREACALTTTHDLPTISGWWRGHDLDLRAMLTRSFDMELAQRARENDRRGLWRTLKRAKCARGPEPAHNDEHVVVDATLALVAKTASRLCIVPVEDIAGQIEQPNLPGTIDEHPNWRRRLPSKNGLGLSGTTRRLEILARERPRS
jgi:4-alpha-glucanotransferase